MARAAVKRVKITTPPPWLPEEYLPPPGLVLQIRIKFSKPERKVYRKRQAIKPSTWGERHRYVTSGPLEGGRWSKDLTPRVADMLDASFFPSVREITDCKSVQSGGTTMVETGLGYAADRRPGPALVVYPDRGTARENNQDNLQPMIKASPRLRSLMTGVDDDIASLRIRLTTMLIHMGWSGSATSLGNKSCMYLVLDEIDKYTETPNKKEAATIDLAEKRKVAYLHDYKMWKLSTPTVESGPIWQSLLAAQVIFICYGVCSFCGKEQLLEFGDRDSAGGIKWPAEVTDHQIIEDDNLAWYQCHHCQAHWNDHHRKRAVDAGCWRDKKTGLELFAYLRANRPSRIAFHRPAWQSPFIPSSEIASRFIKGQGNKTALKDYQNNYAAEPWLHYEQERQEDRILNLRDDRPRGLVPGGGQVACLIGSADTQDNGFYYQIRAWGYGLTQESWLIREGFVDDFAGLEEVFWQSSYLDASGNEYRLRGAVIDAMGHRTKEVYDFCRRHRGKILPLKGEQTMAAPFAYSKIEVYPGTSKSIPGGIRLLRINTNLYKDNLASKLEVGPADPGAFHFHKDYGVEWAAMMCAEFVNDKGVWDCPSHKANHGWDIEVYNMALADVLEVQFWPQPENQHQVKAPPPPPDKQEEKEFTRPSWLDR